ncbi:hypothetical protein IGJ02_000105 [Enterococcus sp. DIV0724b]
MAKETIIKKSPLWIFYFMESALVIAWIVYVIKFTFFYQEAYFYVDKRLSLLYKLLSFMNGNWSTLYIYLITSFLLIVMTFFLATAIYSVKQVSAGKGSIHWILLSLSGLGCLVSGINILWPIYLILLILAGSVVFITYTIVMTELKEEESGWEEDNIEIEGPFETIEKAQAVVNNHLSKQRKDSSAILGAELYLEEDDQYYVEIYVKKNS